MYNNVKKAPVPECPVAQSSSLLSQLVDSSHATHARLCATLEQARNVEDYLIGGPVQGCGTAGEEPKKSLPALVELREIQIENFSLLDELGNTLDRVLNAVRK